MTDNNASVVDVGGSGADVVSREVSNAESVAVEPVVTSEPTTPKYKNLRSALRANLNNNTQQEKKLSRAPEASNASEPSETIETESDPILPPQGLAKDDLPHFEKLTPELKKWLSKRAYETNTSFLNKTRELSEKYKPLESLIDVVKQHGDEYAREGISEADVVRRSIAWDRALRNNDTNQKMQAAKQYLQAYGIDPNDLVLTDEVSTEKVPSISPEEIKQQVLNDILAEQDKFHAQSLLQENIKTANDFLMSTPFAKDPGTLSQLEEAMAPIVAGMRQADSGASAKDILQRAYEYVTKGDSRFSELRSRYEAKPQADKIKEQAQRAALASRGITGGPGNGSPIRDVKSFRDNLRLRLNDSY